MLSIHDHDPPNDVSQVIRGSFEISPSSSSLGRQPSSENAVIFRVGIQWRPNESTIISLERTYPSSLLSSVWSPQANRSASNMMHDIRAIGCMIVPLFFSLTRTVKIAHRGAMK